MYSSALALGTRTQYALDLLNFRFHGLSVSQGDKPCFVFTHRQNKNFSKSKVGEFKKYKFFVRQGKITVNPFFGLTSILTKYYGKFVFLNHIGFESLMPYGTAGYTTGKNKQFPRGFGEILMQQSLVFIYCYSSIVDTVIVISSNTSKKTLTVSSAVNVVILFCAAHCLILKPSVSEKEFTSLVFIT